MGSRTNTNPSSPKAKQGLDPGRIDFVGQSLLFGLISIVLVVASFGVIAIKGLNYGIDFAGGTEIQVKFAQAGSVNELRKYIEDLHLNNSQVQGFGEGNEFLIRF